MNVSRIEGLKIDGISACVPKTVIDNHEFGKALFGEKIDEIIRAVGVEKRRVCGDQKLTSLDLCVKAAEKLFESGIDKKKIGGIVFVTLTPDNLMPNNASFAQHLLGLQNNVAAFDINHACSGYTYGLWISSLMAKSLKRSVLLLDGDTNSYYVSPYDKSTAILFGDAGTATVISPDENTSNWYFGFDTDGSKRDVLTVGLGFRNPVSLESLEYKIFPDGSKRRSIDMSMDGQAVFNYVVQRVSKIFEEFMNEISIDPSGIDYLVLHQANAFMLRQLARKTGFSLDKVPMSMNEYGNTSSPSIPLNIVSRIEDVITQKKSRMLLSGFGAGLATGIVSLDVGKCLCPGVMEYE